MDTDCRTTDITFLCYYEIYYYQVDSGNVSVDIICPFICSHILFLPPTPVLLQIFVGEHYCTSLLIKMVNHHVYPPTPHPSLSLSLTRTLSLSLDLSLFLSLTFTLSLSLSLSLSLPLYLYFFLNFLSYLFQTLYTNVFALTSSLSMSILKECIKTFK